MPNGVKGAFSGHQSIATPKATKLTLRSDDEASGGMNIQQAIRFNLGDGTEIYRGMQVKDVVNDLSQDDLLLAVKSGSSHVVEALCTRFHMTNVTEIRGVQGNFELLRREVYDLSNWNLLLIAIAFDHIVAIKLFAVTLKAHLRIALRTPPISSFSKVQESDPAQAETFPLLLAINNRSQSMLKFLWTDLRLLWDSFHLTSVISELASQRFIEGIRVLLRSTTSHEIYMSMHAAEKLAFLRTALATDKVRQRKWTLEVKEALKQELTGAYPYATVALFVLLNDQTQVDIGASYNLNKLHLDRALNFMDPKEYARFKHTISTNYEPQTTRGKPLATSQASTGPSEDFASLVTLRIQEYVSQEESTAQRLFAQKLKTKLENLDQEVVKLKAPALTSTMDFETILGKKIFDLAENGSLREFCDLVIENDVRIFTRRKRYETLVKFFPKNFNGINRYGYFSPLLIAIQNKHHSLVSFIIEKMKIPIRQTLCLFPQDPGYKSFEIDAVSEEYQCYPILVAAYNKDVPMLKYLWQCLGGFLWTERHFEPLMRLLIETQWKEGLEIIMRSEMTHDMIKALSSVERAYFVENMIGDIFSFGISEGFGEENDDRSSLSGAPPEALAADGKAQGYLIVAETLKQELTRQPYAGLFICYMIDRFEEMSLEDFKFWDQCCKMEKEELIEEEEKKKQKQQQEKKRRRNDDEESDEDQRTGAFVGDPDIPVVQPKYGMYMTELVLLTKSCQTRFSQFILDYRINRMKDRLSDEADKFIDCLRKINDFEPLIEEGKVENLLNGDEEIKFLKKDLNEAGDILVGPSAQLVDLIKFTITGNLKQLQKVISKASANATDAHSIHKMLLDSRGLAVKIVDPSRNNTIINTREWNPIHYAIYFQQFRTLKYLNEELFGVSTQGLISDLKLTLGYSLTNNEYTKDTTYDDLIQRQGDEHLYGLMLVIISKNLAILRYLLEEIVIQISESDIFHLLTMCIKVKWPAGFLHIINSEMTARIFIQAKLDFKEEFIRFALIECENLVHNVPGVPKSGIQAQTDDDVVREVKDRMTETPYSCLSWLYFDTINKELKNQRYVKRLLEETSFNVETLEVLAFANQLETIVKKNGDQPLINVDFLGPIRADEKINRPENEDQIVNMDKDEKERNFLEKEYISKKIHNHRKMYVNKVNEITDQGGPVAQLLLKRCQGYAQTCTSIVTSILQTSHSEHTTPHQTIEQRFKEFEALLAVPLVSEGMIISSPSGNEGTDTQMGGGITETDGKGDKYYERMTLMLRFVKGFYDFRYWNNLEIGQRFEHLQMDEINLFQWILFFNDHSLLEHIMTKTPVGEKLHLISALQGDHQPLDYVLHSLDKKDLGTVKFEKLALLIALLRRSFHCLKLLLVPKIQHRWSKNLLTSQEVLNLALVIANEPAELWNGIVKYSQEDVPPSGQPKVTLESRFIQMCEKAFTQVSLKLRVEFLRLALRCTKGSHPVFVEALFKQAFQFKQFAQWLLVGNASEDPLSQEVRNLIRYYKIQITEKDKLSYDSEISRLNFLARLKPNKIETHLIDYLNKEVMNTQESQAQGGSAVAIVDPKDIKLNLVGGGSARSNMMALGAVAPKTPDSPRQRMIMEHNDSAEAQSD